MNSDQRQEIVEIAHALSHGRTGNLSVRVDEGFLITPTGIANDDLKEDQIVFMDMDGESDLDQLKPSSEWRFQYDLYKNRKDINAILHTHSTYATVLACHQKEIPPFHYMIAEAGGDTIRCADYATFGTQQLSDNIIVAMKDRKACLMANHGMLAVGENLKKTLALSEQVEELARQYVLALQIGSPVILSAQEMAINIEKFKYYGKQND
jgi:L-fuculose-phosphate aldolase